MFFGAILGKKQISSADKCFLQASLRHPGIVHLFGTINNEEEDELWVVLEFCKLGSLERILRVASGTGSETDLNALLGVMPEIPASSNETATTAVQQKLRTILGGPLPGLGTAFFHLSKDIVKG